MGVHGLWELLSTVGCRVSVEALANRKLAIDASIWMIQFMKAMRDERGDMLRNAHLLGFFRRICKLLFLRIKPIFVFDGGTPVLKRRTVLARRRQRENAQAKIRSTAEKLLLNHLKTKKLEEIMEVRREEIKQKSKSIQETTDLKKDDFVQILDELGVATTTSKANTDPESSYGLPDSKVAQEAADALLAASLDTEWKEVESSSADSEDDENEELLILPAAQSRLDPTVLASLPPSMQLDLLVQMREQLVAENRQRFEKVAKEPSSFSQLQIQAYLKTVAFRREVNEVQRVASGKGIGGVPSARIASESDREYIFSSIGNNKNVSITSDSKKSPAGDGAVAKETANGTTTSLPGIAAASSSSPFVLEKNDAVHEKAGIKSPEQLKMTKAFPADPVQTYMDEKGQLRVSRVRAMGVRMTRDLQWNLYLLKDKEAQSVQTDSKLNEGQNNVQGENSRTFQISFEDNGECDLDQETVDLFSEVVSNQSSIDARQEHITEPAVGLDLVSRAGLGASFGNFSKDEMHYHDLGGSLSVEGGESGGHGIDPSSEAERMESPISGKGNSSKEEDDCEWEEGEINWNLKPDDGEDCETKKSPSRILVSSEHSLQEHMGLSAIGEDVQGAEGEVEWETGIFDTCRAVGSPFIEKHHELISDKSEEAQLEEAIRRSLKDQSVQKLSIGGPRMFSIGKAPDKSETRIIMRPCSELDLKDRADQEWKARERKGKALAYEEKDVKARHSDKGQQVSTSLALKDISSTKEDFQTCSKTELAFSGGDPGSATLDPGNNEVSCMDIGVKEKCYAACEDSSWTAQLERAQHKAEYLELEGKVDGLEEIGQPVSDGVILEQLQKGADSRWPQAHISHVEDEVVHMELEPPTRAQKAFSASCSGNDSQKEDIHVQHLLKEAEEADLQIERQQLAQWEEDLSFKRQELEIESEKLQAELQAKEELSQAQLENESEMLIQEELELRSAQKKNERNADSVTGEMFAECQELLQMFGLPYVIAPMEAEAQCGFMDSIQLVDGVVTDDSDVFLFGGRNVYKNIFDDHKYVETYYMKDIEAELGLNRENLIHMALLLGSDYTEGVSGIGIVNAIEVVNAFAGVDGLQHFKEWIDTPDPSLLVNLQLNTRRRGVSRKQTADPSHLKRPQEQIEEDELGFQSEDKDDNQRRREIFIKKHRAVSKNWNVPDSFPNRVVIAAYASPQVDTSSETFTWGRPDLEALRKFCVEKFSWSKEKADDLLLPVLKEYDRRETQLRLEAFYSFNQRFAKIRSRRIQKAVTDITGHRSSELMDFPPNVMRSPAAKKQRKRKSSPSRGRDSFSKSSSLLPTQDISQASEKDIVGLDSSGGVSKSKGKSVKVFGKDMELNSKVKPGSFCSPEAAGSNKIKKPRRRKKGSIKEASSSDDEVAILRNLTDQGKSNVGGNQQQLRRSARVRSNTKYTSEDSQDDFGEDDEDADISAKLHQPSEIPSKTLAASMHYDSQTRSNLQKVDDVMKPQFLGGGNEVSEMYDGAEKSDHLQLGGGFIPNEEDQSDGFQEQGTGEAMKEQAFGERQSDEVSEMDNGSEGSAYLHAGGGFVPMEEDQTDQFPEKNADFLDGGNSHELCAERNVVGAFPKESPETLAANSEVKASANSEVKASANSEVKASALNSSTKLLAAPFFRRKRNSKKSV